MKIGLTFDLRQDYADQGYDEELTAEFDEMETIVAIDDVLRLLGHAIDRIGHAHALIDRLAQGVRWDMVFNIAEGMHGFGRQSLVPALLDSYRIPYVFSDPLALAVTLHKATAKQVLRDRGMRTADFAVIESGQDVHEVAMPFPLFAKPVAEGTSKGISAASVIRDQKQLAEECRRLLQRYRQPVLVETYLPGREFTVGVLGTGNMARALGVMEMTVTSGPERAIYSYENKKNFDANMSVSLADDGLAIESMEFALKAWRCLGGRDAGRIDLRCDGEGRLNFIEANPLAGLHPRNSDLPLLARLKGMSYADLIEQILISACRRLANADGEDF